MERQNNLHMLAPMTIRGKQWKNRIVLAPKGGMRIIDGEMEQQMHDMLSYYGMGHPAEVIIGETPVSEQAGRSVGEAYDFKDPKVCAGIRKYASMIKEQIGAVAMVELFHAGDQRLWIGNGKVMGPMAYTRPTDGAQIHAMTQHDIRTTCDEFAQAAYTMKQCGFDGVVVHAGHGWLLHQFFSPITNKRTDAYGGSLDNRCRFAVEVLHAIRDRCGENFVIECRISGSEHRSESYTMQDISTFANLLSQYADIIHVSAGLYRDPCETGMVSGVFSPHGLNLPVGEYIKKHGCRAAVTVVGGWADPGMIEEAIASGGTDFVAMLREFTAEPKFVDKVLQGRAAEIRPCIRCLRCFPGAYEAARADEQRLGIPYFEMAEHCSVNPQYFAWFQHSKPQQHAKKNVLVIGCGVGGMQTAITARQCGHEVTVIDRAPECGGILRLFQNDPHKQDLWKLTRSMKAEADALDVRMRLSTPFSEQLLQAMHPQVIVAAIGAEPIRSAISGLASENVMLAQEVFLKAPTLHGAVVILGGGMVGCETALRLAELGADSITIVEMRDTLASDAYRQYGIDLRKRVLENVTCRMNVKCTGIERKTVWLSGADGVEQLHADYIINAIGMRSSDTALIRNAAMAMGCDYYEVGDCLKPRNICMAIEEGYHIGNSL